MKSYSKTLPFRSRLFWGEVLAKSCEQPAKSKSVSLREELRERILDLPDVFEGPSRIRGIGAASSFLLGPAHAEGPPEAYLSEGEFAFFNPLYGDALHLTLPRDLRDEAVVKGWGEVRPVTGVWGIPPVAFVVYDPRDKDELNAVWYIVLTSYAFARGRPTSSPGTEATVLPRPALVGAAPANRAETA